MEDADRIIDDHLRCAVCQTITTDSLQCFNGHVHCAFCLDAMRQHTNTRTVSCSCCRTRRGWAKTRFAVDLAIALGTKFQCNVDDCDEMLTIDKLDDHRACCPNKRFDCPLSCECDSMHLENLVEHMRMHRRTVKYMTSQDYLNLIVQASETPRMHILVMNNRILCVRLSLRLCRIDSVCLEIHAGIIGYTGHRPKVLMNVTMYDMCSTDMVTVSHNMLNTESSEYLHSLPLMHCYDNFVSESIPSEGTVAVHDKWTRDVFLNRCQGEVFEFEHEHESSRVVAVGIHFEDVDRDNRLQ